MSIDLEHELAASNPVQVNPALGRSARAESTLVDILALTDPQSESATVETQHRWLRMHHLVPAAAMAVAVSVLAVVLTQQQATPTFAVTPAALQTDQNPSEQGASADLRTIANAADGTADDTGAGNVAEVRMKSWSLFTRVDGRQVTSQVVPMRTVTRTSSDGTATVEQAYSYNGDHTERFTTAGALDYPLRGLSANPDELGEQLGVGQPASNGTAGLFDSIVVANRQMPIEPRVRAAILRVLADAPGVSTVGRLADRKGRTGVGFTTDSAFSGLPTRYLLVFDPSDGELLGYEETLTTTAGKLNVRVPAVINYQVFESSRYVN